MEQKKLSHIFEEEFKQWTSLKIFWICLVVMMAGVLALCATVFYLENGAAAEVLSRKELLIANVWGRAFMVIAIMPVVIMLFMYGFAVLMGGLAVLAERNKRKQAAILGVSQIQEHSKEKEVADTEKTTESEDAERETKKPFVRGEDHGKASKVTIDYERFRSVFKQIFIKRNANTDSCSFDILVRALEGRSWTKSDLARVALLIHESDVMTGDRKYFNKWLDEFFEIMGRDDLPKTKTVSEFHDLSESSICFRQVFNDLVYTYYAKTEKSTLIFDVPITK